MPLLQLRHGRPSPGGTCPPPRPSPGLPRVVTSLVPWGRGVACAAALSTAPAAEAGGSRWPRPAGGGHPPGARAAAAEFLAPPDVTHESIGLSPPVADGLRAAGFARPSAIAAAAAPPLVAGRDVVLAAETGSGKTLAYLAPLVSRLRSSAPPHRVDDDDDGRPADPLGILVLAPNAALCDQVVAAARAAFPGLTAARVTGSAVPPSPPPDLTVATPAGLLGATYAHGASSPAWNPPAVVRRTRAVVLDEADALLGGGYANDTARLLAGLRGADAEARSAEAEAAAGLAPGGAASLPRKLRRAAAEGGASGLAAAAGGLDGVVGGGGRDAPHATAAAPPAPPPHPLHVRQYVFCAATLPPDPRDVAEAGGPGMAGAGAPPSRARPRKGAPAGGALRARFPDAVWVTGRALHRTLPRVRHAWVDVAADEGDGGGGEGSSERGAPPPPPVPVRTPWKDALVAAVRRGADAGRTLVFVRDPRSALRAADALRDAGIGGVATYTAADPPAARAATLAALAAAARPDAHTAPPPAPSVLVATDAAARGLDVPGLTHVVQAHFAANAVDFLHRVGRTARAGGDGAVTSLVEPGSADLAAAVRGAVEAGSPLEGAFSRKRSFRRKLRRYGEYVPRGQRVGSGGTERKPAVRE